MKTQPSISFLPSEEAQVLLKKIILEKSALYQKIQRHRQEFLRVNGYINRDSFGQWFLEQVFDRVLDGRELKQLERELSSLCFELRRLEGKISKRTKWEDQYEKATDQIRIGDVFQRYLHVENFRRNVKCPFHEDKFPSLKVYEDSNYFVCFGCNARGSPVDFVMQFENCSFKEAVSILSNF